MSWLFRLLDRLPDNRAVGFVASMLFFVLAQAALLTVCFAVAMSIQISPLTLIGWAVGSVLFYRRFMR